MFKNFSDSSWACGPPLTYEKSMAFYHGARGAPYIKLTTDHWQLFKVITPHAVKGKRGNPPLR
jgi:hypothetical protein